MDAIERMTEHAKNNGEHLAADERCVAIAFELELLPDRPEEYDEEGSRVNGWDAVDDIYLMPETVKPPAGMNFYGIVNSRNKYRWVALPAMQPNPTDHRPEGSGG